MHEKPDASVLWLTGTAWASLLIFAVTNTLVSVSLQRIGEDLDVGFALRGALGVPRSCALALVALLSGYAADRLGKRWFLVGGMLVIALSLLWIGAGSTYLALMAGLFMMGAGLGCIEALASPLVAQLHPRSVAAHMNVLHAFFPFGVLVSSIIAGFALDRGVHWRLPFSVLSVPAAVVAVMFLLGRYPGEQAGPRQTPVRIRDLLMSRTFWLLAAAMALTAGCEGALLYWIPNFIQSNYRASATTGAYGLMVVGAAMAVGRLGTGAAVRFVSIGRLMIATAFLGALATLCVALAGSLQVTLILLAPAGLFAACFWPSILSLASERIAAASATLFALLAVAGIVGFGLGPLAVGALAQHFTLRGGLVFVPLSFTAAGLVLIIVLKPPRAGRDA